VIPCLRKVWKYRAGSKLKPANLVPGNAWDGDEAVMYHHIEFCVLSFFSGTVSTGSESKKEGR
jgi:hypothetical protein